MEKALAFAQQRPHLAFWWGVGVQARSLLPSLQDHPGPRGAYCSVSYSRGEAGLLSLVGRPGAQSSPGDPQNQRGRDRTPLSGALQGEHAETGSWGMWEPPAGFSQIISAQLSLLLAASAESSEPASGETAGELTGLAWGSNM